MRIAVVILCLFVSAPVLAQPYGTVWLLPATDSGYEISCIFTDDHDKNLCGVVVLVAWNGTYSAIDNFRVVMTDVSWVHLSDQSDYWVLGNSQTGASVAFEECLESPIQAMTIQYFCPGSSPCGRLNLVSGVLGDDLQLIDCNGTPGWAEGGHLTVNGIYDVPPGGQDPDCYCPTVAAEGKTWGAIKSLYE